MGLRRSFGFAFAGVAYLLRTQRNFRIEVTFGVLALAAGVWLRLDRSEWVALFIMIALVLVLEAVNTAIENAVTLASPDLHPSAKVAKDVAAAAVLVAAVASLAVGSLLFVPRLLAMLGV